MEELILKAQKGDKEAFTEIILAFENDLYKIAKTRIINEADIEDAIQETMIETYKSIKKLKEPKKLKKWLIKILINKCNRIYKRKYKKDVSIDNYFKSQSISTDYINIENDMNFYSLLNNLTYTERIIVVLYYKEQYKIRELKEILKMNENTIRTHLFRAREKIKKSYKGRQNIEHIR